ALAPATVRTNKNATASQRRYWAPPPPSSHRTLDARESIREWRNLFFEALLVHLDTPASTWSTLSGGLDSSGLVMGAHRLFENGVIREPNGGTVTITEPVGIFDDTRFLDDVTNASHVKRELIVSGGLWHYQERAPWPKTDRPDAFYAL